MPIIIARHAGFCMGVKRAVDEALKLSKEETSINSLGKLVHNPSVVAKLERKGVQAIEDIDSIKANTLLIRSHGVSKSVIEKLSSKSTKLIDLTCPFVSRLHKMVADYSKNGDCVIIVGDKNHPEIIGTIGWCNGPCYVVNNKQEAEELPHIEKALAVAQTTLPQDSWEEIIDLLKQKVNMLSIKNTICTATTLRQSAAKELAKQADAMIVVGGKNSANTQKLYSSCKKLCERTILVECACEIPERFADINTDIIGITAGASTPQWSIEEVVTHMADIENKDQLGHEDTSAMANNAELNQDANLDFASLIDANVRKLHTGQRVTGTVVDIKDDEVYVFVGTKQDGILKKSEMHSDNVQLGDEIEVDVVKLNDGEGNIVLSQRKIVDQKAWDALVAKFENNEYVEAVVKDVVKGGVIARISGIRIFIPASHLSLRFVDKLDSFKNKSLKLKIIEVDQSKKRIVASHKQVLQEEASKAKEEAWGRLEEGAVVEGIVRRLTDFGAFVDLGGVDGLIHVTDLSWGRVKHPRDVVKVNQKVMVKVLSLNKEDDRISLGLKQTMPEPWENVEEKYPVGAIVEGKVVRIVTFGAFVELEPGLDGLVHISQCDLNRINKVEDVLKVGQEVRAKVLSVDTEGKRISLSIREALAHETLEDDSFLEDELTLDDDIQE